MNDLIICQASGNSMYPAINDGDYLTIAKNINKLNVGDIALFYGNDNKMYVHRIIKIFLCGGNLFVVTKGDNSFYPDTPMGLSQIVGVVVSIR